MAPKLQVIAHNYGSKKIIQQLEVRWKSSPDVQISWQWNHREPLQQGRIQSSLLLLLLPDENDQGDVSAGDDDADGVANDDVAGDDVAGDNVADVGVADDDVPHDENTR